MNGSKEAKPKYSKNAGEGVDTTAQAAGIIAGRYMQIKSGCIMEIAPLGTPLPRWELPGSCVELRGVW